MGYIKHHTIVVTGGVLETVTQAHQKAKEIFEAHFKDDLFTKPLASRLVSDITHGLINGQSSFFIAPDGSKEGWETSNMADAARNSFLDWLKEADNYCEYVEIMFGGDDEIERITRSTDSDLISEMN